jgi:predicted Fe-Mo cluster-binding NifX family protein
MVQVRIAIPSTLPGGLESAVGEHFGHCDLYTVVDVTDGLVAQVGILPNVPHEQGGCLGPVNHLARHGVNVLIAGGMGLRPLMGFNEVGIEVFRGTRAASVEATVQSFLEGGLERFTTDHTCGGGHQH